MLAAGGQAASSCRIPPAIVLFPQNPRLPGGRGRGRSLQLPLRPPQPGRRLTCGVPPSTRHSSRGTYSSFDVAEPGRVRGSGPKAAIPRDRLGLPVHGRRKTAGGRHSRGRSRPSASWEKITAATAKSTACDSIREAKSPNNSSTTVSRSARSAATPAFRFPTGWAAFLACKPTR